jgi:Fe-S-cluster containining protein
MYHVSISVINNIWYSLREIDENLFTNKYVAHCLDCSFCEDVCCNYGCQMDWLEMERVLRYATQLEAELGIPSSQWFEDTTVIDADYPSGKMKRTRVYKSKCVFYKNGLRGCTLHRFGLEKGIDIHLLKPMVCCLFPVTWDKGRLLVSNFLDELPCSNRGISIFEAQKDELRNYLGNDFVTELERRQHK